jgi:dTDP-4-dehydrorhamnose reductase
MHLLLLGKNGQLGWELRRTLPPLGRLTALDYPEIDLVHPQSVCQAIEELRPDVVINATAYTAVDRAESEAEIAMAVNAAAPGQIAAACAAAGAALVHYSTDYVFDGTLGRAYVESDAPNPLNVYGQSKLAGEQNIETCGGAYLILRTSWVYSLRRDSFVTKVLQWSRQQPTLRVVADQVGSPTWARMLAEITAHVLAAGQREIGAWLHARRGVYHLAGSGAASRLEWAQAILRLDPHREEQICQAVLPALTSDFPTPAQRPLYSALDCARFEGVFGLRLPDWEAALALAMEQL